MALVFASLVSFSGGPSPSDDSTTLMTGVVVEEDTNKGFDGDLITDSLRTTSEQSFSAGVVVAADLPSS